MFVCVYLHTYTYIYINYKNKSDIRNVVSIYTKYAHIKIYT